MVFIIDFVERHQKSNKNEELCIGLVRLCPIAKDY